MSVGKICQRDVDLADLDESAWSAAERMHQRSVGSLLVLNEDRQPIGIVTDRDLVINVLAHEREPRTTRVREIMTAPINTIREDASIEVALSLMRRGEFRRIPVIDQQGRLVGVLSLDDVLTLLADEFSEIGHLLERQTPRAAAESTTRSP